MKLVEIKNISKIYHTNKNEILALKDISFDINDGDFIAIVGPSGCGKSTILSILCNLENKSGGNIIKVFNSIEKNMFNRRKLENELKSLTSSSKLIMYVLMIVPIVFVIFISLINKEYFQPLLVNPLGIILGIIMVIIYITYIIVVRRVLKVRGIK